VFDLLSRGVRSVMAGILALTLLTPFLRGVELALQAGNSACEMQCCRTTKAACHRSGHDGGHQFPRWTAGLKCPSGCGQVVSLTGPVCPGLTADVFLADPSFRAAHLPCPIPSTGIRSGAEFALFERPPPFFG
jgi:hypothetical protein